MTTIPTEPIWIEQSAELAELCERWREQGAVAIDTEFMRSDTFYPIAALIQVGDGRGCYLLDPLAIEDFEPLRALMLDTSVTKVMHSCSEDLEVFQRLLDVVPEPIFDTQIGAAFAGLGFSIGYANLVNSLLGIELPKGETRSDWLQRPLSQAQLKYAALDVAHMLVIYGKLLQTLKDSERLQWVRDDCADLVRAAREIPQLEHYYTKLGSAWKLRRRELAVLQRLCQWRETEARARNLPRNRLVKEAGLWELARWQPEDFVGLQRLKEVPSRLIKEDGEQLLALIKAAQQSDEATWPERLAPPLGREHAPLLKALKQLVRARAEELDLPPELLMRKREYEALVRSGFDQGDYQLPERLLGWRYTVIGESLLNLARDLAANQDAPAVKSSSSELE